MREAEPPAARRLPRSARSTLILSVTERERVPRREHRHRPAARSAAARSASVLVVRRRHARRASARARGSGCARVARYVVRGRVFSSASSAVVARLVLALARPRLFGSLRSPKTIACVGQAAWQAVTTSPSRIARSSRLGVDLARRVDALHAVGALLHHAAAADRDVGIVQQLQRSACRSRRTGKKLKRRTLYGQLFEQYRVPTQRL